MIDKRNEFPINSYERKANGNVEFTFVVSNKTGSGASVIANSYKISEMGIYAQDDSGTEILYAYNKGTDGDYIPVYNGKNAIDIIENQKTKENTLVINFLKNIYDNFDYTLYNVPSNAYIEESRKFETEAIAMQKEKINNLKMQKKISHHEADTLLRDLNYNEALLYANNIEE